MVLLRSRQSPLREYLSLLRLGNVLECTGNVQGPSKNVEPTAGLHLGFCKKEICNEKYNENLLIFWLKLPKKRILCVQWVSSFYKMECIFIQKFCIFTTPPFRYLPATENVLKPIDVLEYTENRETSSQHCSERCYDGFKIQTLIVIVQQKPWFNSPSWFSTEENRGEEGRTFWESVGAC